MQTLAKDQRYTRVVAIPGKTYTCGCDIVRYTALVPKTEVVNKETCPTHGCKKA